MKDDSAVLGRIERGEDTTGLADRSHGPQEHQERNLGGLGPAKRVLVDESMAPDRNPPHSAIPAGEEGCGGGIPRSPPSLPGMSGMMADSRK